MGGARVLDQFGHVGPQQMYLCSVIRAFYGFPVKGVGSFIDEAVLKADGLAIYAHCEVALFPLQHHLPESAYKNKNYLKCCIGRLHFPDLTFGALLSLCVVSGY